AREAILIGQDTTAYGEDLGIRDGLPLLLERLAAIDSLSWVRFLYCYPNRITPRLLDTIAAHQRLVKYLDVPLQHASQPVLARMKRGGSADALLRLVERIRASIPGVWLRTSFIAGFPGETESDFRELCDFVRAAQFDWLGVFAYSDDETAESHSLDGKIDAATIAHRRDRLMSIQRTISRRRLARRVGQSFTAILEGPSRDSDLVWQARLEGMAPEIDGRVLVTEIDAAGRPLESLPGSLVRIEITAAQDYDLVGRVTTVLDAPRTAAPSASSPSPEPALRILV
ncbi:MAG TPA: radical SAM protein, partial [Patescibacteria group bacterium]|nr:radical SAM protein [Patescibacteria group bacterium]